MVGSWPLLMLSDSHFTFKNNDILESDRFYTESICLTVAGLWRSLHCSQNKICINQEYIVIDFNALARWCSWSSVQRTCHRQTKTAKGCSQTVRNTVLVWIFGNVYYWYVIIYTKTNLLVGSWPLLIYTNCIVKSLYHWKRVIWLKVTVFDTELISLKRSLAWDGHLIAPRHLISDKGED